MNETMNLLVLMVFDVIIVGFGIYMLVSAMKMKKKNEINTMILTEEEMVKCQHKTELADFLYWREAVLGGVFVLSGAVRLLDKFVLKIGGMLDMIPVVILLLVAFWFLKCLQTARAKFL